MNSQDTIFESVKRLDQWLAKHEWQAYDPFDGLSARGAKLLTLDNHYLRIVLQQGVRRFPINLRPLLGIKMQTASKGMGFCALGYLNLYQATGEQAYLDKLRMCLDWLMENYSKGYSGYAWGNHFSYESRGGRIPLEVPTIVWTSWIANAFLDAYEVLKDHRYFDVAKSAGEHILKDIGIFEDDENAHCFMYTPRNKENPTFSGCIHNSNVLGAWLLARLYRHTNNEEYFAKAQKAVNYTMKYQRPKGGWWYGEPQKFQWEDNFHTGYNLESIYGYIKATGETSHEADLKKGFKYWMETFFEADGTPRYYDYKTYPIDIQCASQAIQTLVNLREYDTSAVDLAVKVAIWTIQNMQDADGQFYFRKYPVMTNKTPMFHWAQSTMLAALGCLMRVLSESEEADSKTKQKQVQPAA